MAMFDFVTEKCCKSNSEWSTTISLMFMKCIDNWSMFKFVIFSEKMVGFMLPEGYGYVVLTGK